MILLLLVNLVFLLEVTGLCKQREKVCEHKRLNFIDIKWCCSANERCGTIPGECVIIHETQPFTYVVIILSIVIISIFLFRCLMRCLSCRNALNESLQNNIYQSVVPTDPNISNSEEYPPSYEEVMNNNNNLYRFENPR